MRMQGIALALTLFILIAGACSSEQTTEVPVGVEKVVEREVIREVPFEPPRAGALSDEGTPQSAGENDSAGESLTGERMIVRSGTMNLKVKDVAEALEQVEEIAESLGGHVVSSSLHGGEKVKTATISVRVPAEQYDDAMESLRDLAVEVILESTRAKDVTEEYTDNESQLRNLEATEERYLALLNEAATIEDILDVEEKISETRGRIERIKGRMQYLERTSASSLIEIYLIEESALEVDFEAGKIEIEEGERVWFENLTTGGSAPYGYKWDFGDGKHSTELSGNHIYDSPGTYTVALTVTDGKGNTDTNTKADYITVVAKPGWSPGNVAQSAWRGLVAIGRGLGNFFIWIGILAVVWLPILLFIHWIRRRRKPISKI